MNIKVPLFDIPEKVVESLDVGTVMVTADDMIKMQLDDPPFGDFTIRLSLRSLMIISYEFAKLYNELDHVGYHGSREDVVKTCVDNWGNLIVTIRYCYFTRNEECLNFSVLFETNELKNQEGQSLHSIIDKEIKNSMAVTMYNMLTVLLATKNIDRKVVINSARSGSKRARDDAKNYSSTTYLNIGKITETCNGGSSGNRSGGPTRPHLRRGHIRLQRYGEGLKESKQIFIQPTFVNADKEWIDRQKTYKFTGSHDASASSGLTASRETRKREIVDHVG